MRYEATRDRYVPVPWEDAFDPAIPLVTRASPTASGEAPTEDQLRTIRKAAIATQARPFVVN